jgi:hypothetical protein
MISSIKPSWREPEMRVLSSLRELEISLKDWERYQRYSLDEIYSILQNDLKTLRSFRDEIKELLGKGY